MTIGKRVTAWVAVAMAAGAVAGCTVTAQADALAGGPDVITPDGFGVLRIGMTRAEIDAALGSTPIEDEWASDECEYYSPLNAPDDLLVMVENGVLTRITVMGELPVRTADGVGLGEPIEPLKARYQTNGSWTPHVYVEPPAGYLTLWADGIRRDNQFYDAEGARGLVLEADIDGKVAYIHAGTPSIQYVEGCS